MSSAADRLSPRIYVACLAAYNAGHLHGAWIDVEDKEAIKDAITAMLSASPIAGAEQFAIHDDDGFGGMNIGEYEPIGRIVEIACARARPARRVGARSYGRKYRRGGQGAGGRIPRRLRQLG